MLYEKLMSVHNELGSLAHQVSKDVWEIIKLAKAEIKDAAETAKCLESNILIGKEFEDGIKANTEV